MGLESPELERMESPTPAVPPPPPVAPDRKVGPRPVGRPPGPSKVEAPVDPAKRAEKMERNAVLRALRKAKTAKTKDEMWRELEAATGKARPKAAEVPGPTAGIVAPPALPAHQDPEVLAMFLETAEQLWSQLNEQALLATRYALKPNQQKKLTDATTPVLAKWVPKAVTSPEATLGLAVALVFLPPAVKHASELLGGWYQRRKLALEDEAAKAAAIEATP